MRINVKFREGMGLPGSELVAENVGIEVGKGVLAIFPGGSEGDGTCTMYPLDVILAIDVQPAPGDKVPGEPIPIRRDHN